MGNPTGHEKPGHFILTQLQLTVSRQVDRTITHNRDKYGGNCSFPSPGDVA